MRNAQIIIIGGGISGLINAILLSRAGLKVLLLEKNKYPFHRVCGEYISNEVVPFLEKQKLYPHEIGPSAIKHLEITSVTGECLKKTLDLGGFGISRYQFDQFLAEMARKSGVDILENTTVKQVYSENSQYFLSDGTQEFAAELVIGAHGKRSSFDKHLKRDFLNRRSPYVGIKYHLTGDYDDEVISLHNFEGGYCGINSIEDGKFNLCYLIQRDKVRDMGSIHQCEEKLLSRNPRLKEIFINSEFLFEKPLVVNEVSFSSKGLIKNGLMFTGDAAGTIAPFSGNGMAMAIKSAKYLSEAVIKFWDVSPDRQRIFHYYKDQWRREFSNRIARGKVIQHFFGHSFGSALSVKSGNAFPFLVDPLVRMTHGQPFS